MVLMEQIMYTTSRWNPKEYYRFNFIAYLLVRDSLVKISNYNEIK